MKLIKNILLILAIIILILILNSTNIFAKTVIVDTDTLKLRKEASTDSITLELLNKGQELEFIEESGSWYKVKINGMTGFVHKDYTKLKDKINNIQVNNKEEANIEVDSSNVIENTIVNSIENNVIEDINNTINETDILEENNNDTVVQKEMINKDCKGYILPLINSNIIEELKKDDMVAVITKANNWLYVETNESNVWIRVENIVEQIEKSEENTNIEENKNNFDVNTEETINEKENTEIEVAERTMYVNTSSIYVRKGPGTDYDIIDSLILNSGVIVIAENGDWYKVKIQGQTGYIAKRLLSTNTTQTTTRGDNVRDNVQESVSNVNISKGEEAVEYAKTYLGCKYVYGASGPNTFDCSGFTMFVLKKYGITLSHSAIAQSKVGSYVAKENLQAGDLVFFTDYETGKGIGHCGIYIGDGNFIHASSGTGYCVKISTLTSGSYYNRYETARRVL